MTMRERSFGLVEIFDEDVPRSFDPLSCQPAVTPATTEKVNQLDGTLRFQTATCVTGIFIKNCETFDK